MKEFYLFNKDLEYKKFNERIIPTKYEIVGIRVPILKKYVKSIKKYIRTDRKYYEDFLIEIYSLNYIEDSEKVKTIEELLEYFDNWALVDLTISNLKFKNLDILKRFLDKIKNSKKEFIIRYYIGNLMKYYLDTSFDIVKTYENTKFYYVDMMVAWYYQNYYFKVDKETINKHLEEINNNIKKYTIRKIKDSIREKK
jgi:hypothetical protein